MRIRLGKNRKSGSSGPGLRSKVKLGRGSKVVGVLFGLPFFLMGSIFCWMGGLHPLFKALGSGDWPEVPCVITHSEVDYHPGDDGATYSVDINFRYTLEGRTFTGGSYDFSSGSSSGESGKRKVVGRYPVGRETVCYINPSDPQEAVLSRKIPGMVWFVIPFSSIFILVGLGIILGTLGLLPRKWKLKVHSRHKPVAQLDEGEKELKPKATSLGKVLGTLFVAAFWNGIVGVFVWQVVGSFQRGDPQWFLVVFLVPFVVVGLFLICLVPYYLLAMANPKFKIILSEGNPRLGDSIQFRWQSSGSVARLESLVFSLEGVESATYRRGTRSVTDHSTFYREVIHEERQFTTLAGGTLEVAIPVDGMHSFNGGNNRIAWRFRVRGSIRKWPDVDETYPVTIRPIKLR